MRRTVKSKAEYSAKRKADAAAAVAKRDARRRAALHLMSEWEQGMPPLSRMGADIGTLRGLVKDGLASELDRDALGDPRFTLTEAGRQEIAAA